MIARLAAFVLTLLAASLLIFLAINVLPGDPAEVLLGINADPQALSALRERLGLDDPLPVRFLRWLGGVLTGDFGRSATYDVPVSALLVERLAVSVPLAALALILTVAIALPAGLAAVASEGRFVDRAVQTGALVGLAVPNVWLGLMLIAVFAVSLGVAPAGGFPGWSADPVAAVSALLMPAFALAVPQAAILTRLVRAAVAEAAGADYAVLARAKGRSVWGTIVHHALPNAWGAILTIIGLQFGFLVAGAIVIETVFSLPGLGRLLFQAVSQRDLPVVQGVVLVTVATVMTVNALCDALAAYADPRARRR